MPVKPAKKSTPKKKYVPQKKSAPKKLATISKPKFTGLPDYSLTDMRLFYRLTNWEEMWRDFNLSLNADGRPKYRTIRQFANDKKESEEQFQFLIWFLGTPEPEDPQNEKYDFAKPLDFYQRRESGGWFSESALKLISKNVIQGTNALHQIQAAGNDSALLQIYRIEKMKQELDRSFQGSFFAEGLSMRQNDERMRMYLEMHRQLDTLAKSAIEQFALTRGINFADMNGYAELMQGLNISIANFTGSGQPISQQTEVESYVNKMVRMTMAKAKMYDLPVPKSLEPETIDVTPDDEKQQHHHKKNKPN
jgi:hypothetical protein